MFTFLLSFADPENRGHFLGACIVDVPSFLEAIQKCWDLGINPGGEIRAYRFPPTHPFPPGSKDRLLTREEAEEADAAADAALNGDN